MVNYFMVMMDFANLLDWLEFSIINLKKLNKRILIKPHPNFYNKLFGKVAEQDREIFLKLKRKYEDGLLYLLIYQSKTMKF